jgi:putative tricarboxylic transport membrane protein
MKKADLITGIVLLALSGYVIQESWRMPQSATFGPGVGFLPFWLGVMLAILSVVLIVGAWRRVKDPNDKSPFPAKHALISVGLVMAGLGGYIVLMEWLGYIVNTILLVVFLLKVVEKEPWPMTLLVAVLTTASLYIIFQVLLGINLPANQFGF